MLPTSSERNPKLIKTKGIRVYPDKPLAQKHGQCRNKNKHFSLHLIPGGAQIDYSLAISVGGAAAIFKMVLGIWFYAALGFPNLNFWFLHFLPSPFLQST